MSVAPDFLSQAVSPLRSRKVNSFSAHSERDVKSARRASKKEKKDVMMPKLPKHPPRIKDYPL